jgi:hypothetical protein
MTTQPAQSGIAWVYILPVAAVFVGVWALLKPNDVNWSDYALELARWAAVALILGAVLLALLWKAHDFLHALGAMWRPISLLILAVVVLFVTDQGKDLGVSLLSENRFWPILSLFVALLYWAANTWHSARLGLHAKGAGLPGEAPAAEREAQATAGSEKPASADRPDAALTTEMLEEAAGNQKAQSPSTAVKTLPDAPKPALKGDEHWLYWPPRLLGVFAHLSAAINLSPATSPLPPGSSPGGGLPGPRRSPSYSRPSRSGHPTSFGRRGTETRMRTKRPGARRYLRESDASRSRCSLSRSF